MKHAGNANHSESGSLGHAPDSAPDRPSGTCHLGLREISTFRRLAALTLLAASLSTCEDRPLATEAILPEPSLAISDAVHMDGNPGFFFLPPLAPDPSDHEKFDSDGFDPTQVPVVEICALGGTACSSAQPQGFPITFTTTSGAGSESIRLVEEEQYYVVDWHTDLVALDPATTYRIRVLLPGIVELGFADVRVVDDGRELRSIDTDQNIALKDGRTLPVKFRIEHDATATLPDVAIEVSEGIQVTDHTNVLESVILAVTETIHLVDEVTAAPPVSVAVAEAVHIVDEVAVRPPATVAVAEAVHIVDEVAVSPPVSVAVAEDVRVVDEVAVLPSATIAVTETVHVLDATTALPPVVISITERITVTDEPAVSIP